MKTNEATANVFLAAFRALPRKEREVVVEKLLKDRDFVEDLVDIAILARRRKEPSRPLDAYLAERRKKQADGL